MQPRHRPKREDGVDRINVDSHLLGHAGAPRVQVHRVERIGEGTAHLGVIDQLRLVVERRPVSLPSQR